MLPSTCGNLAAPRTCTCPVVEVDASLLRRIPFVKSAGQLEKLHEDRTDVSDLSSEGCKKTTKNVSNSIRGQ